MVQPSDSSIYPNFPLLPNQEPPNLDLRKLPPTEEKTVVASRSLSEQIETKQIEAASYQTARVELKGVPRALVNLNKRILELPLRQKALELEVRKLKLNPLNHEKLIKSYENLIMHNYVYLDQLRDAQTTILASNQLLPDDVFQELIDQHKDIKKLEKEIRQVEFSSYESDLLSKQSEISLKLTSLKSVIVLRSNIAPSFEEASLGGTGKVTAVLHDIESVGEDLTETKSIVAKSNEIESKITEKNEFLIKIEDQLVEKYEFLIKMILLNLSLVKSGNKIYEGSVEEFNDEDKARNLDQIKFQLLNGVSVVESVEKITSYLESIGTLLEIPEVVDANISVLKEMTTKAEQDYKRLLRSSKSSSLETFDDNMQSLQGIIAKVESELEHFFLTPGEDSLGALSEYVESMQEMVAKAEKHLAVSTSNASRINLLAKVTLTSEKEVGNSEIFRMTQPNLDAFKIKSFMSNLEKAKKLVEKEKRLLADPGILGANKQFQTSIRECLSLLRFACLQIVSVGSVSPKLDQEFSQVSEVAKLNQTIYELHEVRMHLKELLDQNRQANEATGVWATIRSAITTVNFFQFSPKQKEDKLLSLQAEVEGQLRELSGLQPSAYHRPLSNDKLRYALQSSSRYIESMRAEVALLEKPLSVMNLSSKVVIAGEENRIDLVLPAIPPRIKLDVSQLDSIMINLTEAKGKLIEDRLEVDSAMLVVNKELCSSIDRSLSFLLSAIEEIGSTGSVSSKLNDDFSNAATATKFNQTMYELHRTKMHVKELLSRKDPEEVEEQKGEERVIEQEKVERLMLMKRVVEEQLTVLTDFWSGNLPFVDGEKLISALQVSSGTVSQELAGF